VSEEFKPLTPGAPSHDEELWPTLTAPQMARLEAHGRRRKFAAGEVLMGAGQVTSRMYVVTAGELEIVRPRDGGEDLVVVFGPGKFTGEANMLTGRRGFVTIRARTNVETIEVDRRDLLSLVQTDSELSDILMRAYMLRRLELITRGYGDVVLVGSRFCASTLRIKEFLTRNGHPYSFVDLDRDSGFQELLDRFSITEEDVPVLICRGNTVLRNPSNREIADCLGFNESIDQTHLRDLVIIGAGPSGLAAAVYGASEGLDVLVIESNAPGGQAGLSSKIENYLGFPTGVSGQKLAALAYAQAQKFGAQILIAKRAKKLVCARSPYVIEIEGGPRVSAKAVIIATGAAYRRLPISNLTQFEGVGVYYAATPMEAQLSSGEEVAIIGGGNAAGQAAVFLAESTKKVNMLVRSTTLADSMSRYLIRRLEEHPAIEIRTQTELVALQGNGHLESLQWRDNQTGQTEDHNVRHVFVMTGAIPSTKWLDGCLAVDGKGFIKTGPELSAEDLVTAGWKLSRPPFLLETSLPGVFAVGDVRRGNLKRVASAVGEGSIAVAFVHQVLHE